MVKTGFERFLDEPAVYRACQQFWEQLTADIARSIGSATDWQPWIPRTYANGTPMELDGNPIWDGRSEQLGRAYRIIQYRAEGNDLEIAAWLKTYEAEYTDLPRHELFINLSFSDESAAIAAALLRTWMTPETTQEQMQAFMRTTPAFAE